MSRRSGWTLDSHAFERLLAFLDDDRDRAADKYEDIRGRLVKLFAWRGCTAPEEYADRTIDRVARRLLEGADVHVTQPFHYFHGVAMNVLREHWREPDRKTEPLTAGNEPAPRDGPAIDDGAEAQRADRRLFCLERCLSEMPPRHRDMLLDYHGGSKHIARRQALALSLGIPINALRIRMYRIRTSVESCVTRCLEAGETNAARTH